MATNRYTIYHMLMMSIVGALLLGCSKPTPSPTQMDKSPFTGIPCSAPCWYGLKVDESSEKTVLSTMRTLTFINQDSIQLFRMGSAPGLNPQDYDYEAKIVANCIYPEKQCLTLKTKNYTLTEIEVLLNYESTVDKAIGYLGDPDYIGYLDLGTEQIICQDFLIWNSKQLVLASKRFEGFKAVEANCGVVHDTGKIAPGLLISEARYLSSTAIETLLSTSSGKFFEFSGTLPEK